MNINPEQLERRNPRLEGFDDGLPGMYFVTICTQDRACLFGAIHDHEMHLNDAGRMILEVWQQLPTFYEGIDVDAFVVMPNHVHGIVQIVGATPCGRPGQRPVAQLEPIHPKSGNVQTDQTTVESGNTRTHQTTVESEFDGSSFENAGVCVCRATGDRGSHRGSPLRLWQVRMWG
jgi:hypothetical protein